MTLSGQMIYTVAPHPDKQSLSAPARRHCEIVSNRSSGSRPGFHIDSHMPISCAFRIHYQWSHQVLHSSAFDPSLRVLQFAALSAPLQTKFHPPPRRIVSSPLRHGSSQHRYVRNGLLRPFSSKLCSAAAIKAPEHSSRQIYLLETPKSSKKKTCTPTLLA